MRSLHSTQAIQYGTRVAILAVFCGASIFALAAPASALTPNEKFVTRVYAGFYLRAPSSAELLWGATILGNGGSRTSYTEGLFKTAEWRAIWIRGNYQRYLVRDPSSSELSSADSALQVAWNYRATETSILASSAYFAQAGSTNERFVVAINEDVMYRETDSSIVLWYSTILTNGSMTRQQVADEFIRTQEAAAIRVRGLAGLTQCLGTTLAFSDDLAAGSYCLVLDRMADTNGANGWITSFVGGSQLPTLWVSFAGSTEYWNLTQV